LRELRVHGGGQPIRIFYALDPRRVDPSRHALRARTSGWVLLIGGNKAGNNRFYAEMIALADRLYDDHLAELEREGL